MGYAIGSRIGFWIEIRIRSVEEMIIGESIFVEFKGDFRCVQAVQIVQAVARMPPSLSEVTF
jgi:hypothetical protein